jgi:polysaccharide pyruvyl transferase CsaB
MKVLHMIGGGDVGGAKTHVLSLVKQLSRYISVKIVSFRPGMFSDEAAELGIDIEVVKSGNILKDILRVVAIVDEGEFDIIHSHGAKANMISIAVRTVTKSLTVTTVHSDYQLDYMHSVYKRFTFGAINTVALRFIDNYIAVSNNFADMLIERKFQPDRIFTLYNGLDFDNLPKLYSRNKFIERFAPDVAATDIIVGIAARLYPVKGLETLLKAAECVRRENSSIKFIIGGDGEDREHLEEMSRSLGLSGTVFFTGWLSDPYMLMSIVDISVLTSISESFPYSILEGARFSKATISTGVGGIPDLIRDGTDGLLFVPGDHDQLASHILALAGDAGRRSVLGRNLYGHAKAKFSLDAMCGTQLGIYDAIYEGAYAEAAAPAAAANAAESSGAAAGAGRAGSARGGGEADAAELAGATPQADGISAAEPRPGRRKRRSKNAYDILISGYYGFHNTGDDAMLMGIISHIRSLLPAARLAILSKAPIETALTYRVNTYNRLNLMKVLRIMKKSRLFVYGGGNIIQDSTSTRSLLFYLAITLMAKLMSVKVMFFGNGFGPLTKPFNRSVSGKVLNRADVITVREELSLRELAALSVTKPDIMLTADPALLVTQAAAPETVDALLESEGIPAGKVYVGFSVRDYPVSGVESKGYLRAIAMAADAMAERYGIVPVFIPMEYPRDVFQISKVMALMRTKGYVVKSKYSVPQILGIIARMDMIVAMRLHALIFAANLGVPVIAVEYQPKIEGFIRYIGQASAGKMENLEFEALFLLMEDIWRDRAAIRVQLLSTMEGLRKKARLNAEIAVKLLSGENEGGNDGA